MGYGMGAAIGAKMGNPERPVALVTGDGSFHMNLNELATAVSLNLPIIILVLNNGVLGMVHQWQALFYGKRYSHTILDRKTDYVALAEAFGARGFRLDDRRDARCVMEKALATGCPCVVDCRIDVGERVYPIIPPGKSGEDMIFCD
jgi:Thiamine pyrophosphate-requiring enzymes [acetolactate synthase, pyruvate dehydrogenase (cytochrome), glyoxylate carboligase, phosphonopyruvate decarboxylase]